MRTGRWLVLTLFLMLWGCRAAGATEYYWVWTAMPDAQALKQCLADMQRIAESEHLTAKVQKDSIVFNVADDEPFAFPGRPSGNACETDDGVVPACLIAARDHFSPAELVIRSDADWSGWSAGAQIYQKALGRTATNPMSASPRPRALPYLGLLSLFLGGNFVLWAVQAGMTVWMLVDIARSNSDAYWYYIVLFFQPLGTWIYFFVHKIQDYRPRAGAPARRLPLPELRYNLKSNPCLTNRVALADRLRENPSGRPEARELYQQVLRQDDTDKSGLFGLGQTLLEEGDVTGALAPLQKLIKLDPSYRDYRGAEVLAQAQWRAGQRDEALQSMERLVRLHPRFPLFITYARMLGEAGRKSEAQSFVQQAIEDFRQSPRYVRRMHGKWPQEAKRLMAELRR